MLNIIKSILKKIVWTRDKACNGFILKYYKVTHGENIKINGVIRICGIKGRIALGNNVTINSSKYGIQIGYSNRNIFWILDEGKITAVTLQSIIKILPKSRIKILLISDVKI